MRCCDTVPDHPCTCSACEGRPLPTADPDDVKAARRAHLLRAEGVKGEA